MIAPQHRMIRILPSPMPRRLLPAIPSSLSVSATPMINVTTPSITDDIATTTTTTTLASLLPPSCMLSFNHGDNNSHMPMWMNSYPFTAQSFIDNNNDINNNGAAIMVINNTISVPPPPCSTNLFSFQFYYMNTTTESSMTMYYANNDNSTSRTLNSHVCPSFL
ncbi:hypothetical protein K492DRAFT_22519 [Lichtheimia hyalospora FSU 10163]|nr:hypothetical protein K492DRAFT_22519 [Lichtheimia hyalospora FSU 10163]